MGWLAAHHHLGFNRKELETSKHPSIQGGRGGSKKDKLESILVKHESNEAEQSLQVRTRCSHENHSVFLSSIFLMKVAQRISGDLLTCNTCNEL